MTDKATHTPLPWAFEPRDEIDRNDAERPWIGRLAENRYTALACGDTANEAWANAALIVHAVNGYHQLIEALEALLNSSGARDVYHASKHFDAVEAAESLLAALKEAGR